MIRFIAAAILALMATTANASWVDSVPASSQFGEIRGYSAHPVIGSGTVQRYKVRSYKRIKTHPIHTKTHIAKHKKYKKTRVADIGDTRVTVYQPHPAGCPSRAFCGCGTSIHIFGKNIRDLWLARNWFKFPPASPAPGMVAVRRHHVFAILKDLGGNRVLAYDPNSGGHKTRIHVRSLAGYSVRNPRA